MKILGRCEFFRLENKSKKIHLRFAILLSASRMQRGGLRGSVGGGGHTEMRQLKGCRIARHISQPPRISRLPAWFYMGMQIKPVISAARFTLGQCRRVQVEMKLGIMQVCQLSKSVFM